MRGRRWVIDADIRGFFDALDPQILDSLLRERISDRRVLKLLRSWLRAGVLEGETLRRDMNTLLTNLGIATKATTASTTKCRSRLATL